MNLLEETIKDIKESGHTPEDIVFIGSEKSGYCCEWEDFKAIANIDYPCSNGGHEIAGDLVIVFRDGSKMWRDYHESNGFEHWSYSKPFKMPEKKKQLLRVTYRHKWGIMKQDLEDMHTKD